MGFGDEMWDERADLVARRGRRGCDLEARRGKRETAQDFLRQKCLQCVELTFAIRSKTVDILSTIGTTLSDIRNIFTIKFFSEKRANIFQSLILGDPFGPPIGAPKSVQIRTNGIPKGV